ncbi:MAG: hypothetical protein ACTTHG_02890 [Treponemataceae bacterium]
MIHVTKYETKDGRTVAVFEKQKEKKHSIVSEFKQETENQEKIGEKDGKK